MPSGKTLAWQIGISIAVVLGMEHYKQLKGQR